MSNKDDRLRREGLAYAIRYLETPTPEELKEEAARRGASEVPMTLPPAVEEKFCWRVQHNCIDTLLIMTLNVLHDEFGFGEKRLNQFKARFNLKTDCMEAGLVQWDDLQKVLLDECNIKTNIRWNGDDPSKRKEKIL